MKRFVPTGLSALALLAVVSCNKPPPGTPQATTSDAVAVEPVPAPVPQEGGEPAGEPMRFELTDDTELEWTGYKVVGQHSGSFLLYEGTVDLPVGTLDSARFNVVVETMSVVTDDDLLTRIVKDDQFFDVNNYPEMTFVSTGVQREGEVYWVTGNLTIRDVTKSIRFPAAMSLEGDQFTLNAEFTVNRRDWNIIYEGIGDNVLKNDVLLSIDVTAERVPDAPVAGG